MTRRPKPMVVPGTVRIGGASGIPAVLQEFGCDPAVIIARAGLSPDIFEEPETLVPVSALGRLLSCCVKATKCEHFGLLVGERGGFPSLGRVGFVARNSADVGAALTSLATYMPHHDRGAAVTLSVVGPLSTLGYAVYHPTEAHDQLLDGAVAIGCCIMRALCGPEWAATEVTFAHRAPSDLAPYRRFFRCKLRFDAGETALVFETRWLGKPLHDAEPELRRLLVRELEASAPADPTDLIDSVRGVIRTKLGRGPCTSNEVARLFGISERTLRRQLVAHGTSFKAILEEVRFEVARQLLRDTTLTLERVALLVDYSELSAFSRAFLRWAKMPPGDWRELQRGEVQPAGAERRRGG